jgi:hypothetical protein
MRIDLETGWNSSGETHADRIPLRSVGMSMAEDAEGKLA